MNVLERITELRLSRNWSEYQLAEQSGLTPSTISSWYHRNLIPSIPSIERICVAFGITMSQFFLEKDELTVNISPDQCRLLNATNKLTPEQIETLIQFISSIK